MRGSEERRGSMGAYALRQNDCPSHKAAAEKTRAARNRAQHQYLRTEVHGDMGQTRLKQLELKKQLNASQSNGANREWAQARANKKHAQAKEEKLAKWQERIKAIEALKKTHKRPSFVEWHEDW